MCDAAYVLLLDQLERTVLADRQTLGLAKVFGAEVADLPDLTDAKRLLDESLLEPFQVQDSATTRRRRALGLIA